MEVLQVEAKARTKTGGNTGRQIRALKQIPVVLYGHKLEKSINLVVDEKSFEKGLRQVGGDNVLIDLTIAGQEGNHRVFLRDIQRDPVSGKMLHADLLKIDESQKLRFSVPIHSIGESKGVKTGGILDHSLRTLEIRCLAKNLPSHVDIDVTNLELNQSLHVNDLKLPDGVEVLIPPTVVVVKVIMAKMSGAMAEPEAPGEKAEEEIEPEVIGEKKEEVVEGEEKEKGKEKEKEKGKEKEKDKGKEKEKEKGKEKEREKKDKK
jgi:large subunit ribosomal protein L25